MKYDINVGISSISPPIFIGQTEIAGQVFQGGHVAAGKLKCPSAIDPWQEIPITAVKIADYPSFVHMTPSIDLGSYPMSVGIMDATVENTVSIIISANIFSPGWIRKKFQFLPKQIRWFWPINYELSFDLKVTDKAVSLLLTNFEWS